MMERLYEVTDHSTGTMIVDMGKFTLEREITIDNIDIENHKMIICCDSETITMEIDTITETEGELGEDVFIISNDCGNITLMFPKNNT